MFFSKILIVLLFATSLFAKWTPINTGFSPMDKGQGGNMVPPYWASDLTLIGNNYYAVIDNHLYYSSDKGITWHSKNSSPVLVNMKLFEHNGTMFISSLQGIYKSSDGGDNWKEINNGIKANDLGISCLAFVGDKIFALGMHKNLYISKNNGDSWESILGELNFNNGVSMISNGNDVYIGSNPGLYRTSNDGAKWDTLALDSIPHSTVTAINIIEDNIYFACTDGEAKLFVSTDNGKKWLKNISLPISWRINSIVYSNKTIYLCCDFYDTLHSEKGIFYSTNYGNTWDKIKGLDNLSIYDLEIDNNIFIAGGENGIYTSSDYGVTWTDRNENLPHINTYEIIQKDSILFVSTQYGLYSSINNGNSWVKKNNEIGDQNYTMALTASYDKIFLFCVGSAFRSTNNGDNWEPKNKGKEQSGYGYSFIIDDSLVIAASEQGIYKSTNSGDEWIRKDSTIGIRWFYALAKKGNYYYAATGPTMNNSALMFRSSDKGESWELKNSGIDDISIRYIFQIKAIDNDIYACTSAGLFVSQDDGESWKPKNNGLPNAIITSIEKYKNLLLLATQKGFYISFNNGDYWYAYNEGLNTISMKGIVVKDDIIFLATGIGMYKDSIATMLREVGVEELTEKDNYLYTYPAYPTPSRTQVRSLIFWDLSISIDNDEIGVYDIYGIKVAGREDIIIDKLTTYSGTLIWDCSAVPSGIYLIKINHGTKSMTIKAMVEK